MLMEEDWVEDEAISETQEEQPQQQQPTTKAKAARPWTKDEVATLAKAWITTFEGSYMCNNEHYVLRGHLEKNNRV